MTRSQRYESLRSLARDKRAEHNVSTTTIGLGTVREVYKKEGIKLDLWHQKLRKLKAAYLVIDGEPRVMVNASLPAAPRLFAECHELKHHFVDRELAEESGFACREPSWHTATEREIGAEIFAAEFIYPEVEFLEDLRRAGLSEGSCGVEQVIAFKRSLTVPVSYTFLRKRLEFCGIVERGTLSGVQWQKREEAMYGLPTYKRIQAYRTRVPFLVDRKFQLDAPIRQR